ncbi:MAG: hypothetical protein Q8L09_00200 [Candidatus Moranbacteria bacterium]|nr:hypothetical protein [Candidatus Moranbacteria bacterium]
MNLTQEKNPGASTVIIRKPSFIQAIGLILIGVILGSAVTGILFSFRANKAGIDVSVAPQADQNSQPAADKHDTSAATKALMSIEMFSFSGVVTAMENNTIMVRTSFYGEEKNYRVLINESTKISKKEANQSSPEGGNPNANFSESQAKISDINKGNGVFVDSSENIKDKTEFVAKSIMIFDYPPLPTNP